MSVGPVWLNMILLVVLPRSSPRYPAGHPHAPWLTALLLLHTQVITKVVLGMELTPQQRTEFENEFRVWLKHVSSTVIINIIMTWHAQLEPRCCSVIITGFGSTRKYTRAIYISIVYK
jgi:hypothetical protein